MVHVSMKSETIPFPTSVFVNYSLSRVSNFSALSPCSYPTSPSNELAKLRLAAEQGWLNLAHDIGIKAQVFRLGGIYGPSRRL